VVKGLKFSPAVFIKTAIKPSDFPKALSSFGQPIPEVAVAGRSNVGKSSLLNDLFQVKGLVKTSSTPGKTQALNFFVSADSVSFVDLPGYGYAKVPVSVRAEWGPMVQQYLNKREALKVVLFLIDIRRVPGEEDLSLMNWAVHKQKAVILVLTKVDKVKNNEKEANTRKILAAFNVENLHYIHYSVTKNQGRKELISLLTEAIQEENSNCQN
jgi:GTP-binding protein